MTKNTVWMIPWSFLALLLVAPAHAAVFFDEDFPTDGVLTTVYPDWPPYPAAGAEPIVVTGGAAVVNGGSLGTEDAHRATGSTLGDGQTWYYGARLKAHDVRLPTDNDSINSEYFIGFKDEVNSGAGLNLTARLIVMDPAAASHSNFRFAISSFGVGAGGGQIVPWTSDLTFETTYTVIVSFTALDVDAGTTSDGFSRLWVDPTSEASPSVLDNMPSTNLTTAHDNLTRVFLRQDGGDADNPTVNIDELATGTTFAEVLAALGGAPAIDANFDGQGVVDGNDFLIWQRNVGATGQVGKGTGDSDGNHDVNSVDLDNLKAHFGLAAAAAVPEPGTVALGLMALAGLALARPRR